MLQSIAASFVFQVDEAEVNGLSLILDRRGLHGAGLSHFEKKPER